MINFEVIKYLFVGGLNAVFTFLVFTSCLYLFGMHYSLALTLAWLLGILLTYMLNFVWVFKPEKQFRFQERFAKYLLTNIVTFAINLELLHYLVDKTHFAPFYLQLLIMPGLIAANFAVTKFWSMRRRAY